MNNKTKLYCTQCNSELILVSKVTESLENSRFPQTTSVYRCSNASCQSRMDKETDKRNQQRKEREDILEKKRSDNAK